MRSVLLALAAVLIVVGAWLVIGVVRDKPGRAPGDRPADVTGPSGDGERARQGAQAARPEIFESNRAAGDPAALPPGLALMGGPQPLPEKIAPNTPAPAAAPDKPQDPPPPAPVIDSKAREWRVTAVKAPAADVRIDAINKLGFGGGPDDIALLNQIITSDPNIQVREAAQQAALVIHSRFSGQPGGR